MDDEKKKNYGKILKILQITAGVFMLAMAVVCIVLIKKYDISLRNISGISEMLTGGTFTLALIIILFTVIKSFALVFPPAIVFAVCGYVMPNFGIAFLVNVVAMFASMSLPYFLGKFTGKDMLTALSGRFKAVKKLDEFTEANEVKMTFIVKLSGILPGDLSSLIFGAMNVSFRNFTVGANLGMLPLAVVYTLFGVSLREFAGRPWLFTIPVVVVVCFTLIAAVITKRLASKNKARNEAKNAENAENQNNEANNVKL